jgi:DNA-binding MarR family transcriptional regulator
MSCLCASLRRASRLLTRYYDSELKPAGLTPTQFEILSILSEGKGRSQSDLVEALGVDQTTLSRNMKVLCGKKWISASFPGDRRRIFYSLTASGKAVFRDAMPHWRQAQRHMKRVLGGEWMMVWSTIERLGTVLKT